MWLNSYVIAKIDRFEYSYNLELVVIWATFCPRRVEIERE